MHVEITSVRREEAGDVLAAFRSEVGTAEGVWVGVPPQVNRTYDVELEVPGNLTWGNDLTACDGCVDAIRNVRGGVIIQGRLENVEDDGTVIVRVGGGLLLLDAVGPAADRVSHVRVTTPRLELHDART